MILPPSYQKMKSLKHLALIFYLSLVSLAGCTYRFTNLYLKPPPGVRTVAIESIYDTTKLTLPHELLWESLQKSFAANGHVRLVTSRKADVYIRAHLKEAFIDSLDTKGEIGRDPDFSLGELFKYKPVDFRNLKKADRYASSQALKLVVTVEVWRLDNQQMLLQKTYSSSGSKKIYNARTPLESQFIKADEAFAELFANLSDQIAAMLLDDFLSLNVST